MTFAHTLQLKSFGAAALAICLAAEPARAQAEPPKQSAESSEVAGPADQPGEKQESWIRRNFFDPEDGKLDLSRTLAKGGFVPMPIIITEPAVDGGFGIVAQFVTMPEDDPRHVTRRMAAAIKTGNGSYGYGYFQSGYAFDNRLKYRGGVGRGKVNLEAHPSFLPSGINYTNKYDYGILASAYWRLPDERFSLGPVLDFRQPRCHFGDSSWNA